MTFRSGLSVLLLLTASALSAVPSQTAQDALSDAQHEYDAGNYNRAVDLLMTAAAKSPNSAPLEFLLGKSYYQLGEFSRAIAGFERSVQLAGNRAEYHDWLGRAYGHRAEESMILTAMGWARKSHKEFEEAVRLDPANLQAQRDLIRYEIYAPMIAGGGEERALKDIEALDKIDPLQGQLARGEMFTARKQFKEADDVYAKILESGSDRIGVYFEVADYFLARGNAAKMGEAVADAARMDANDRRLKYYRGVFLVLSRENTAEAESLLKSYLDTVPSDSDLPDHSSAREWLGKLYEAQGKLSEAAEQYRLALMLDPRSREAADSLRRVEKK